MEEGNEGAHGRLVGNDVLGIFNDGLSITLRVTLFYVCGVILGQFDHTCSLTLAMSHEIIKMSTHWTKDKVPRAQDLHCSICSPLGGGQSGLIHQTGDWHLRP